MAADSMDGILDRFTDRYTCITFDHRGSGHSRAPLSLMTTSRMARDALAVLDHVGVNSAHVYGTSLGGMVAQELAIQAPHRVRTLILGATTAGGITSEAPPAQALLRGLWQAGKAIPGHHHVGARGALHQGWAAATHDTTARLHRIQAPTLVLHGSRDDLVPLSNAHHLARLIPGAELRVLRGAGHLFLFDSGVATRVVEDWLDSRRMVGARGRRTWLRGALDFSTSPWRLAMAQTLPTRRLLRGGRGQGR
jgi:pimeloyl-ACP methyl ester carboxylesterase